MKYTVLFLTLLAMTSFVASQKAFDQVKNLLSNMKTDILKEQQDADVRNEKDKKDCDNKINAAQDKVNSRQKDVDDLKAHIKFLQNEKAENEKDKKTREDRIVANNAMLKKFKDERCENNLLFVKSLREHMEAMDILKALKEDIDNYFKNKKQGTVNTAFLERFAEFSHLLSEEHRQVFLQLSDVVQNLPSVNKLTDATNQASAQKQRTNQEVGTQHIDNTQGELKKMEGVAFEDAGKYSDALHQKVVTMIDGLIAHLKESRDTLTKNEIKAAEDFAVFQTNLEKENQYLAQRIVELTAVIEDLTNQLNISAVQLGKRENLLKEAQDELATIKRICQEKSDYYAKETKRRTGELESVGKATDLFSSILEKLSKRVQDRANNIQAGQAAGQSLDANVAANASASTANLNSNVQARNAVVF